MFVLVVRHSEWRDPEASRPDWTQLFMSDSPRRGSADFPGKTRVHVCTHKHTHTDLPGKTCVHTHTCRLSRWDTCTHAHTHIQTHTRTVCNMPQERFKQICQLRLPTAGCNGKLSLLDVLISLWKVLSQKWMFSLFVFTSLDYQSCRFVFFNQRVQFSYVTIL